MPKYYCDYCNIYLTHDAPRVRRDHNSGWKHATNVKNFFMDKADLMELKLAEIYKEYQDKTTEVPPPPGMVYQKPTHSMYHNFPAKFPPGMGAVARPPPPPPPSFGNMAFPGLPPNMMGLPPNSMSLPFPPPPPPGMMHFPVPPPPGMPPFLPNSIPPPTASSLQERKP